MRAASRERMARIGVPVRGFLYAGLLAFVVASMARAWDSEAPVRSVFVSTLVLGTGLWVGLLLRYRDRLLARPHGALRVADIVLMNAVLVLVATEATVALYGRAYPSELLWNETSVAGTIDTFRRQPGTRFLGFPINRGGYHDHEFFAAEEGDIVVALLADSFGLGIVPHAENFTTVAENALAAEPWLAGRRVAVHNFGVAAMGISEYAWLLVNEVPATNPSVVVLCIFVGNDISGLRQTRRRYYCLQDLRVYSLVRRLLAVGREPGAADVSRWQQSPDDGEEPTISEERFLEIERDRLELCNRNSRIIDRRYDAFFDALDFFRAQAGDRLLVVLIPDELQVNDELYETLMESVGEPAAYDRDLPQERITTRCRREGISVLDLLTPLQEEARDGSVYKPRDTHWNARGNRIAGEALAARLRDLLYTE